MSRAHPRDRARAARILALPRPSSGEEDGAAKTVAGLVKKGELTKRGLAQLRRAGLLADRRPTKTVAQVRWLREQIDRHDSLGYARAVARRWTADARAKLDGICRWLPPSSHRDVLDQLVSYVQTRTR